MKIVIEITLPFIFTFQQAAEKNLSSNHEIVIPVVHRLYYTSHSRRMCFRCTFCISRDCAVAVQSAHRVPSYFSFRGVFLVSLSLVLQ